MKRRTLPFHWLLGMSLIVLLGLLWVVASRLSAPQVAGSLSDALEPNNRLRFSGAASPCLMQEAEPNDGVRAATDQPPLCENRAIPATLPEGDSDDLFWIEVERAGTVEIALSEMMPERDYDLYLYDSAQRLLAFSKEHGNLPERIVLGVDEGRYLIRVYPFAGRNDERYILRWHAETAAPLASPTLAAPAPTLPAPPVEPEQQGARGQKDEKEKDDKEDEGGKEEKDEKDKENEDD